MRVAGFVMLMCGLALSGDAFAHSHYGPAARPCYQGEMAYKPGGYCYTSCAPSRACQLEVCLGDGEWMTVGACKARDCGRLC